MPKTYSIDPIAIIALDKVIGQSTKEGREYGGFIYETSPSKYNYTEAVVGEDGKMEISKFNQPPSGKRKVAIYHTHHGFDYSVSYFSQEDYVASSGHRLPIYLESSVGIIKVWRDEDGQRKVR